MYKALFLYLAQDVESLPGGLGWQTIVFLGTNHRALDHMIFKGFKFHENISIILIKTKSDTAYFLLHLPLSSSLIFYEFVHWHSGCKRTSPTIGSRGCDMKRVI
jgi:hypothetical protein